MATFTSTTLTKRTGATTTIFEPSAIDGGWSYFRASGAQALNGPSIRCRQSVNDRSRRTDVRVAIPQLDSNGLIISRPAIDLSMYVPSGADNDQINDLVGYLNALTASSLTNFDSFLVEGVGMY